MTIDCLQRLSYSEITDTEIRRAESKERDTIRVVKHVVQDSLFVILPVQNIVPWRTGDVGKTL